MSLRDAMRDSAAPYLGPDRRFFKDLEAADGMLTASAGKDDA